MERFGVSMDEELLKRFDLIVEARGYASRSEAIRDLIRKEIVNEDWAKPDAEVMGAVVIVYEHHEHELSNVLVEMQHQFHEAIVCSTHVHMDEHNCLEVILIKGRSADIKIVANKLISTRGVKHGELVCTTTGKTVI
jgi:CopG family nickel-responsive transcriptional regulator